MAMKTAAKQDDRKPAAGPALIAVLFWLLIDGTPCQAPGVEIASMRCVALLLGDQRATEDRVDRGHHEQRHQGCREAVRR